MITRRNYFAHCTQDYPKHWKRVAWVENDCVEMCQSLSRDLQGLVFRGAQGPPRAYVCNVQAWLGSPNCSRPSRPRSLTSPPEPLYLHDEDFFLPTRSCR